MRCNVFSCYRTAKIGKRLLLGGFLVVLFIGLASCNRGRMAYEIDRLIGTDIVVPWDSLYNPHKQINGGCFQGKYMYVVYYDSAVCSVCNLKNMYYWETLRDSLKSQKQSVDFVFIFAPPENGIRTFINELRYIKNDFAILVDTTGVFRRKNVQISNNLNLHAFLLNRDKKILMVGNAQRNPAVEELLWKKLRDNDEK